MKVPDSDLVWVTNIRKSIMSMFRIEPIFLTNPSVDNNFGQTVSYSVYENSIHGHCESR